MKSCNFEKCKFILSILSSGKYISTKDTILAENDITEATAAKIFTALNKASVIEKPDRERNKLKGTLVNRQYFKNREFNIDIMASIISRVDAEVSKKTIEYVFNDVPQNIYSFLSKGYSTTISDCLINLFNEEQYKYFADLTLWEPKVICEVEYSIVSIKSEKLVPLRIFFHNNNMYICFYQLHNKKIINIAGKDIYSSRLLQEQEFSGFINDSTIDDEIDKFVTKISNKKESITLWLTSGLLNFFIESKLIDDYEILGKKEYVVVKQESRISRKEADKIKRTMEEGKKRGRVYFNYTDNTIDKYKVKIFSDKYRLLLLVKQFIKKEDLVKYKPIKKHLNDFCENGGLILSLSRVLFFIFWVMVAFYIGTHYKG